MAKEGAKPVHAEPGILDNPRHERFAQELAKGMTATDAYAEAGYKPNDGNAATLKGNQRVSARVTELQGRAAERNAITIDRLTDMLLDDRELARMMDQPSAAISAVTALARLHGLIVDRKEIRQSPKRSASDYTNEELIAIIEAGLGDRKDEPENAAALSRISRVHGHG